MKIKHLHKIDPIVIHQDDDIIALNKPSGLLSLHDRNQRDRSLIDLLRKFDPNATLCHRLDRETSGVIIAARSPEVYREVAMQFEKRKVEKTYFAVVQGSHQFADHVIDLPLSITSRGKAKVDHRRGRPSKTSVKSNEIFKNFTAVECQPESGRLHQIRIHLASVNAPLAGDETYGGKYPYMSDIVYKYKKGRDKEERPMIHRVALHAYRIKFTLNGKAYDIAAPLSDDIEILLKLLRKNDALPA